MQLVISTDHVCMVAGDNYHFLPTRTGNQIRAACMGGITGGGGGGGGVGSRGDQNILDSTSRRGQTSSCMLTWPDIIAYRD